jgi:hypothetical protein
MAAGTIRDDDDLELAKQALRDVLADRQAPAAARAAAARTILELNGALGRNAAPPIDTSRPTVELSRAEMEAELAAMDAANSGTS